MQDLHAILVETRVLLARPDNDFSRSSWRDQKDALAELDALIARVGRGEIPQPTLDVLFLPTGPLQEVSLSSRWANEFMELSQRYDAAMAAPPQTRPWWRFW